MAVVIRPNATKVPDIRKGDTVVAIVGKDAGKAGVVERVIRNQQGWAKTKSRRRRIVAARDAAVRGRRRGRRPEHRQAPHEAAPAEPAPIGLPAGPAAAASSRSPSRCR